MVSGRVQVDTGQTDVVLTRAESIATDSTSLMSYYTNPGRLTRLVGGGEPLDDADMIRQRQRRDIGCLGRRNLSPCMMFFVAPVSMYPPRGDD